MKNESMGQLEIDLWVALKMKTFSDFSPLWLKKYLFNI